MSSAFVAVFGFVIIGLFMIGISLSFILIMFPVKLSDHDEEAVGDASLMGRKFGIWEDEDD